MRWKLLRRRLSISAPRMIVRSRVPWPLRWAVWALALGFSAALALWALELGKDLAGIDRVLHDSGRSDRTGSSQDAGPNDQLRSERDKAQSIANTAESLLKTERTTQERLLGQIKVLEAQNMALKGDLGFFERLLPMGGKDSIFVRGLQAQIVSVGQLRFQLLVMQPGKTPAEFRGRYELTLQGQLDGKSWSQALPQGRALQFRQHQRVEGMLEFPAPVVLQGVQVRVVDAQGGVRASQELRL